MLKNSAQFSLFLWHCGLCKIMIKDRDGTIKGGLTISVSFCLLS